MRGRPRLSHPSVRGSATVVDLGLFVLGLGLVATLFWPRHAVRRVIEREAHIAEQMLSLGDRLESLRAACVRDQDGDGVGEYPPLRQVLEERDVAFAALDAPDTFRFEGYYFTLLLPDRRYQAVPSTSPRVIVDGAEASCELIAWPVLPGETGMRAFCWTPADGLLKHAVDGYPYAGAERPPLPETEPVERLAGALRPARVQDDRWVHPK